jgi:uncharacterized protein (DUF2141 family)
MQPKLFAPAIFLALLLTHCSFAQDPPRPEGLIRVEISGLRSDKGQALCALFSSAGDFPMKPEKAIAHAASPIADHHAVCEFAGIAAGDYAVSVVHDENSNGKLDTNFLGMPREGSGPPTTPKAISARRNLMQRSSATPADGWS